MNSDGALIEQVVCPAVVRHEPAHGWPPVNSPPPEERSGHQLRDWLVAGDDGWVYPLAIYRDEKDRLWCSGGVGVDPSRAYHGDHRTVHVLRTKHGVRVLEWPASEVIRKGAVYYGDCWVVEFPDVGTSPAEEDGL